MAQLQKKIFFVGEVAVNGGGRILDLVGHLAHGDPLIAFADEQLPRRIEDFVARLQAFPFAPFLYSHNDGPFLNSVNVTLLTYRLALLRVKLFC